VRSFVDELTGLYNRRGFLTLAEQQIQTASREERGLMLLFIDIDRMKHINDHFGHKAGDMAIKDTADVLRQTFRGTDIKARLGGDEFAVLAPEVHPARASALVARLQRNLQKHNARQKRGYDLSLSVGFARYDHYLPKSLTELMDQADRTMYADKRQEEQACAA
jgi:diguanylate cyclase (GGDEF)-like protein